MGAPFLWGTPFSFLLMIHKMGICEISMMSKTSMPTAIIWGRTKVAYNPIKWARIIHSENMTKNTYKKIQTRRRAKYVHGATSIMAYRNVSEMPSMGCDVRLTVSHVVMPQ